MRYSRIHWRKACVGLTATAVLAVPASTANAYGLLSTQSPSPSASASSDTGFANLTPAVAARLDTAIKQVMREANVPGVAVSVSAPGKGSYVKAFGVADKSTGAPMKPDLYVRIGSETKTFTVTALLQLVDQGKLAIDDPISKYVKGVPNGDKIRLRDLADMRSGLFNYSEDPGFVKAFLTNPKKPMTPQQLLDYSFKHPVAFQPGTRFVYCNTNLILLGLVVEKVGGMPLHDIITQKVLKPAGLNHTVFPTGAEFPNPHAQGYTNQTLSGKVENSTDWNPSWAWAAGAMISNLPDLKSWAHTLATGTLLSAKTQAARLRFLPTPIPGAGYGLGILNVQGWIGHNGSLPGYETLTVYLPEAKATMVVVLNTDILHNNIEPSTLFGQAITRIVSPGHVFGLPTPEPHPSAPSPSSTPSVQPSSG
ncbi:serine hydrolase domain-containing protein [Streptomyces sp. NBC_01431]|uniref:serine hydrolase domain-containing protein n=1 Tax=Streptomyces sp. NBC_01431 TaxID=2903863 RepID=UPI002E335A03|nr:serine hydrolase domain-containing protein [Streptomyces sp. NBC_01431]